MFKIGWMLRIPSLIYFEWKFQSTLNNVTRPEDYFLQMMQSMFLVPEAGKDVFPTIDIVLQNILSIIAFCAFISISIFNLKVVKKLYIFLFCILLFVIGCNQYKLILIKLNSKAQQFSSAITNQSQLTNHWNVYAINFVKYIPASQFRSASLIFILPIIYCPWLIFVQYFDLMATQLLALCYGIANLPGICLALNMPIEAQIFTYNFAVTSFLIAMIYKIVTVCILIPKTLSDLIADLFVLINFNHHEAALIEVPSLLWKLFSFSKQFIVFWLGLFATQTVMLCYSYDHSLPLLMLGGISESVQSPLGFIGFSVVSCYLSRLVLRIVDWFVESDQFSELYHTHGIAEGFSTLLMMLTLNRSLLRFNNSTNPTQIDPKIYYAYGKNSTSPIGLIALVILIILSSIIDSASELISSKLIHLTATAAAPKKWRQHVTPLLSAFILFLLPICICYELYQHFILDFWLMTIMGSFLMTSIHLLKSFISYLIYMNNARAVSTGESYLSIINKYDSDDIILTINVVVQTLEICIAIALIILLIMRSISGHFSLVSLILLVVHFYFNVFERIKVGWQQYKHRKMVMYQIDHFYSVNDEDELKNLSDICAICFNDLKETDNGVVKRTVCYHYFHRSCLKKWLLIKYSCPMCSTDFKLGVNKDGSLKRRGNSRIHRYGGDAHSDDSSLDDNVPGTLIESDEEEEIERVSSSSESSIIYDDDDIDLKVYQEVDSDGLWRGNPDEFEADPNGRNLSDSSNLSSSLDELLPTESPTTLDHCPYDNQHSSRSPNQSVSKRPNSSPSNQN